MVAMKRIPDSGHGTSCEPSTTARTVEAVAAGVERDQADPTHDELVLLAQLTSANTRIANYIARVLDLDRGRTEYTTTLLEVEREPSSRLLYHLGDLTSLVA